MKINDLIIETTRRCQLGCEHCLRGDARTIDMHRKYMEELLVDVTEVRQVTFTGGEPFLNPAAMEDFLDICKQNNIEVNSFYIATNGLIHEKNSELAKRGFQIIIDLWQYCDDWDDMTQIQISQTEWHDTKISDNNMLRILTFTSIRGKDLKQRYLIPEGRGAAFGTDRTPLDNEICWKYPDDVQVYLNCEGEVVWECDFSFDSQDEYGISIAEARDILKELNKLEEEEYA